MGESRAHGFRSRSHLFTGRPQVWGDGEDADEHWKKGERGVAAPIHGRPSPLSLCWPPTSVLGSVHRLVSLNEYGGSPAVHGH